jgi:hypothetical protein
MFEYMVGQIAAAQLVVAPLLQQYIDVSDGSTQRIGKLPRHTRMSCDCGPVMVLEKHNDFLRDFRGDTIHPSTLEIMHELGPSRGISPAAASANADGRRANYSMCRYYPYSKGD